MTGPLHRLLELADCLAAAQERVKALERELDQAKAEQHRLERDDMPELMRELELASFSMRDGRKVELVDDFACGIPRNNPQPALRWLDEHGFGGLIKTKIEVSLDREDHDRASDLAAAIQAQAIALGVAAESQSSETVHPMTLKAFIKEQLEKGVSIPFEQFGIYPFSRAKITRR